jgi:phosphonate transport system ATP-binding protein
MNGALVMETLRRISSAAGLTVVSTLHHVEYARRYADRVLGLRAGRLVFDGPARELDDAAITEIFGAAPEPAGDDVEVARLPEPALVAS